MSIEPDTATATAPRPFTQWLQEQRGGNLHGELSEQLQQLVQAVTEHGKNGSLTLVVHVKPAGNGVNLLVSDDVKVKAPQPERPVALFFADDEGNLSRRDPRQPELPLREIPSERKAG